MKINYEDNKYILTFSINNVEKLMNLNLLYLLFEVNKNIIDYKLINGCDGVFVIKHLFKDMGVKQQYLKVKMNHDIENNCFSIKPQEDLNFINPPNTEMLNIDVVIKYNKIDDSNYSFYVIIDLCKNIEDFNLDKIIGKIIIKLFNNLKEYIEGNIC